MRDSQKCRVVLVTLPETTPVNELLETSAVLTDEIGVALGPVVVNGVDHADEVEALVAAGGLTEGDLAEAARYRASRCAVHRREVSRIDATSDEGYLELPYLTSGTVDHKAIRTLARALLDQIGSAS